MPSDTIALGFNQYLAQHRPDFDAVLIDIDGTLMRGDELLPGAAELVSYCRTNHLPYVLLTNDGNKSPEERVAEFARHGVDTAEELVISCSHPLIDVARELDLVDACFFVAGAVGNPCYARRFGLNTTHDPAAIHDCAAVVIGEGQYDWQGVHTAIFNFFIHKPHAPLIVPNPDFYWPSGPATFGIGPGAKAAFLTQLLAQRSIALEPIFLGKPYPGIYQTALQRLVERGDLSELPAPTRTLMLGDSLHSDVPGANRLGMHSALVLTGNANRAALSQQLAPDFRPTVVFDGL